MPGARKKSSAGGARATRWIACLPWLRTYKGAWARGDALAGITLAAYLLPVGIADASLANLRPEATIRRKSSDKFFSFG